MGADAPEEDAWKAEAPSSIVRRGRDADLPALVEIYNHYVRSSPATFDIDERSAADRQAWFRGFSSTGRYQIFVAEEDGRVLGYACSHPFRPRAAYAPSVETSVYCATDGLGRGLGRRLYMRLFEALTVEDVHRAYAGIALPNPPSIALHRAMGFRHVGTLSEVGWKVGRFWDVAWYERPFE